MALKRCILFGIVLFGILFGAIYSFYLYSIRETRLWWSQMTNDEKLISLRTENGLYYSYYKEFIEKESIIEGFKALIYNNMTEYPKTVNILSRMNVWQEVLLGFMYKLSLILKNKMDPLEFYINSVLSLQGLTIMSTFLLACSMNNSVLAGILTMSIFALNRGMLSRVADFVPLRENFALPFWWTHVLCWHLLMRPRRPVGNMQILLKSLFWISTFLFCLQWQFSQFVLMLETFVVFLVDAFELIPSYITNFYYWSILSALLVTSFVQFGNLILLSSFTLLFLISSMVMSNFKAPTLMQISFSGRLTWLTIQVTSRFILAFFLRIMSRILLFHHLDDSHILDFVMAKLGLGNRKQFDVNLYMCNGAFDWVAIDDYLDSFKLIRYPFLIVYTCMGFSVLISALKLLWHDTEEEEELRSTSYEPAAVVGGEGDFCGGCGYLLENRPELFYHFGMSTCMLFLTIMVQRMQYFITPYVIIFGTMLFGDSNAYNRISSCFNTIYNKMTESVYSVPTLSTTTTSFPTLSLVNNQSDVPHSNQMDQYQQYKTPLMTGGLKRLMNMNFLYSLDVIRYLVIVLLLSRVMYMVSTDVKKEMNNLQEFYDPDTVELLNWIKLSTSSQDVFAGSMQLMAAVKLVANRPIANHPHFEDQQLRIKTKEIYQIYGRRTSYHVYNILHQFGINYIILENSICFAKSNGCQLKDIVDLANGHVIENPRYIDLDLKGSYLPRFCEAIQTLKVQPHNSTFSNYFSFEFSNPTFEIYRLLEQ